MEIIDKGVGGELTFTNKWKKRRVVVISSDGTIKMLEANAHIVQMYFLPSVNAHVQHSCANGGGKGFEVIFKNLWEE